MKIGFDAKWYFRGPPSGRRVVRNLVQHLADEAGDDEIHVFLDDQSRAEGLEVETPEDRRHHVWSGNNQLSNVFVVPRSADRLGLDVVIYQNFVPPRSLARHARVALVYDAIFESHPRFFTPRERLYFAPMRRLAASAERICTISGTERERLVRHRYASRDRIDVMPIAPDGGFRRREEFAAGVVERVLAAHGISEPFVLSVGRLNARKNIRALLSAVGRMRSPCMLVVVGAPDGADAGLATHAPANVRFLGDVNDEELRVLYAAATIFCYPSIDEGFGLCPLESMQSGTPVVASNIPVLTETCGSAAVYVDPRDPDSIASAIEALMNDPARRDELREAGFRRVASFDWAESARCLLATARAAAEHRS